MLRFMQGGVCVCVCVYVCVCVEEGEGVGSELVYFFWSPVTSSVLKEQ